MNARHLAVLTLVAALGACAAASRPGEALPLTTLARDAFGGGAPCREVVGDAGSWAQRWAALGRADAPPSVDFDREVVLIACLGARRSGGHAIEIVSATLEADALVVAVRETAPPAGALVAQVLTAPFHAVRVARRDLPLRWVSAP